MPFSGGLSEQPNKIIAIFNLIEVRRTEIAERIAKMERIKQKGK